MCGPTTGSFLAEKYCILIYCCRVENYTEQKAGLATDAPAARDRRCRLMEAMRISRRLDRVG